MPLFLRLEILIVLRNWKEKYFFEICSESRNCLYELDANEIFVSLGADAVGNLFTVKIENISCGLVVMHTTHGWTTMGKIIDNERYGSVLVLSLKPKLQISGM